MARSRSCRRALVLLALLALVASACGDDGEDTAGTEADTGGENPALAIAVASYEVVAGRDQRVIAGVFRADQSAGVAYGEVQFAFDYIGTKEQPATQPRPGPRVAARFLPLPGQHAIFNNGDDRPKFAPASEIRGVYGAEGVRLETAGFWRLTVTADLPGGRQRSTANFEALAKPRVPAPGDMAPRTRNPVDGTPGVPPEAIDSRLVGGALTDPELHKAVIADSIAAGRAVMVVISTPTFCQSRFCGPITDSVQNLAKTYGDRMDFVHLEVWKNFEAQQLNEAAREWILPPGAEDANEPWTFLVGRDGRVTDRWDNVATDAELDAAVKRVLGL